MRKLKIIAESFLSEILSGFRKERSCMDAIFSQKQILEKRREFNPPTYLLLLQ
jgi:hypothetical protein